MLRRYQDLRLPRGLDQGYFLQRIWQAGDLEEPVRTVLNTEQGHGLVAGRHFEPVLALFVPLVELWPDHRTLLLGQLVLLGLSLPFVWRLARLWLSPALAVLATWTWLSTPALWEMEAQGFRTMALATPFLVACLWGAATGRVLTTAAFGLAALSCREEVVWALLAALPWLWWFRGRTWRDTTWTVAICCLGWLGLLWAAHGGPSTFWRLSELPRQLLDGFVDTHAASHASPVGAIGHLVRWLGPGVLSVGLAPLAGLPVVAWWGGIQASSGLAGPEAVHLLGPAAACSALVLPLALSRLPRPVAGLILIGLMSWGAWAWQKAWYPPWQTTRAAPAAGDPWTLIAHIPDDAAVLTEDRFLPALAARARVYATDDWSEPAALDGHYDRALLREDHAWGPHLEEQGFHVVRVCPGAELWVAGSVDGPLNEPRTPI